ncbi:MAG: hypothetical protein ACLFN5_00180 [bacterium]
MNQQSVFNRSEANGKDMSFFQLSGPGVPMELHLRLEDDVVTACEPEIGYLHRGLEKTAEKKPYFQLVPCLNCYDSRNRFFNNLGFALVVEKLLELDVPPRARWLRTIISELARISTHLDWLENFTALLNLALSGRVKKDRQLLPGIFRKSSIDFELISIGGLSSDPGPVFLEEIDLLLENFPDRIKFYKKKLTDNPAFAAIAKNCGVITITEGLDLSLSGPALRASGVSWDLRDSERYCSYKECDFKIPVGENGDVYDRVLVRLEELNQGLDIIHQSLEKMPDSGPVSATVEKTQLPEGRAYQELETGRGAQSWYLIGNGKNRPYRCRVTSPGFFNLQAVTRLAKKITIDELKLTLASLDISIEEIDR